MSDREIVQPHLAQHVPQFAKRRKRRMRARHLFEHVVTQVELPILEPRPRDVGTAQPGCKSFGLEGAAIKYAVVGIDIGDQLVLDVEPMALQTRQRCCINRDASPLDPRGRRHVPAAI